MREALLGGFADSRILREHGERMLAGEFAPGARVADPAQGPAHRRGPRRGGRACACRWPSASTELYASLHDEIGADLDHSALILELRRRIGAA